MENVDRRIVRSRQALADALIALALEQGYENLTIRAVTEHAGIGYRTFYRHYRGLDDLLLQILTTAFQELTERALCAKTRHGETLAAYTFIREYPDVLRVYINLPWKHPVRQVILTDAAQFMYARYTQQKKTSAPLALSIDHLLMATNHMVAWYLDNIDDYTPEHAAEIHDALVVKAVECVALELRDDWTQERHYIC